MREHDARGTRGDGRRKQVLDRWSLLLVLLAFGLRTWGLDAQSLWWDEGFSLHLAGQGLRQIIYGDFHPPLYHLLLAGWIRIAGASDFAARFLSVLIGTLMVPLAYRLAAHLFDRRTARLAALLVAASPVLLWYSQEARMYELLALEYLTLLVLFHRLTDPDRPPAGRATWLAFALVEIAALYTHYFAALGIVWLMVGFRISDFGLRNTQSAISNLQSPASNLLLTQTLVALAYLPWIPVFLSMQGRYTPPFATPPRLRAFIEQVWHGYNAGSLALVGHHRLFTGLSTLAGILLLVGLLTALRRDPRRRAILWLLGHTLIPLAAIFVLMQIRPFFHPRYTVMLAAPLLVMVARVNTQYPISNIRYRVLGIGYWILLFAVAIHAFTTDPRYQRDDLRGLARYLEQVAGPDDVILFDYVDYPFQRYYAGRAPVVFLDLGRSDEAVAQRLGDVLTGHRRVLRVTWNQAPVDARGLVSWLLASAGHRVEDRPWGDLAVHTYVLDRPVPVPRFAPLTADFGVLRLTGVSLPITWPNTGEVPIALHWKSLAPLQTDLKVALRLQDLRGHPFAQADVLLLNVDRGPTSAWGAGTEVANYAVLPLPRGTPPGTYRLVLRVYDAATLRPLERRNPPAPEVALGTLHLTPADFQAVASELPGLTPTEAELGPLLLKGVALSRREAGPGGRLSVALRWRVKSETSASPQLLLVRDARVLAEAAEPVYPVSRWEPGEAVLDWRDLTVPADAAPGPATLQVAVGGTTHPLATLNITAVERTFEVPPMAHPFHARFGEVAELLGYDLPSRVRAGEPVPLTLYWRALGPSEIGYTVFTHLLNEEGVLIGQHDGVPADGTRPTTGWVTGEIIVDPHRMTFKEAGYTGIARVEIGLYDPATDRRLTTPEGADHVILPTTVEVVR